MTIEEIIQKATLPDGTVDMTIITFFTSKGKSDFMFNQIVSVLHRRGAVLRVNFEESSESVMEKFNKIFQAQ